MVKPEITGIAPFFIVRNVPAALSFYRDRLGFDITFQGPEPDDIIFGIVQRGAAMIIFKDVGVEPVPTSTRDIKQGIARWTPTLMSPIRMPSQPNSPRAMSSSSSHCKILMTGCADSKSRTPTATFGFSAVLVHATSSR